MLVAVLFFEVILAAATSWRAVIAFRRHLCLPDHLRA